MVSRAERPQFLHTALWAVLATLARCQDDILGCGGFVRPISTPDGSKKPDLSGVKAKLYTRSGLLKAETECAPNGYYYIPIYDRGAYLIRVEGPPGWIFEPLEQEVSSTEDGLCSQGKDVDFSIVGFALSGRVCSDGFNVGPPGIKLQLEGPNGAKYLTETEPGGLFSFKDAPPGSYKLKASHSKWKFRTDTVETTMAFGQAEVRDTFGVLGYDLTGKASWDDGSALADLSVFLRPQSGSQRPANALCALSEAAAKAGVWCSAVTNKNGEYTFEHVPPGDYLVSIDPSGTWASKIELQETELSAKVDHGSSSVESSFIVSGYSTGGKVLDASGGGVEGVDVWMQSANSEWKKVTTTSKGGQYTLKGIKSGTYNVEARKEHIQFGSLKNYPITPQLVRVGSMSAEQYSICGRLELEKASPEGRSVIIAPKSRGASVSTTTDAQGRFCAFAAPGEYLVSVKGDATVVIAPSQKAVSTASGPVLDLRFSQVSLQVKGKVVCLEAKCGSGLSVSLRQSGAAPRVVDVGNDGAFEFGDLVPGKYKVEALKEGWCWDVQSAQVDVGAEYTGEVLLRQSGFAVSVRLQKATEIRLSHSTAGASSHQLSAGENRVCLSKAGNYKVLEHPCLRFEGTDLSLSTGSSQTLDLKVSQVSTLVRVVAAQKIDGLKVAVVSGSGVRTVVEPTGSKASDGSFAYDVRHWAAFGEELTVTPSASGEDVMFEPATLSLRVAESSCTSGEVAGVLRARKGLMLTGRVKPALKGVEIRVWEILAESGLEQQAARATTADDGSYSVGPLPEGRKYRREAVLESYSFQEVSEGEFRSVRMGEVRVDVVDADGTGLSGVLLSLSGEAGFRQNNRTGEDGSYTFSSLVPGSYFLRPMLKEYEFKPASHAVTVTEGVGPAVRVAGVRVAFSAVGTLRTLDGAPEKQATVQAVAADGGEGHEETVTDATGGFRLRGLRPGVKYTVSVRTDPSSRIERASPHSQTVEMKAEDAVGLDFVVFRRPAKLDLAGRVNCSRELLGAVRVELAAASNPSSPLQTRELQAADYFEFPALPRDTYVVRAVASLDSRAYRAVSTAVRVTLEGDGAFVAVPFEAIARGGESQGSTPFWVLLLAVAAAAAAVNRKAIQEWQARRAAAAAAAAGGGGAGAAGGAAAASGAAGGGEWAQTEKKRR